MWYDMRAHHSFSIALPQRFARLPLQHALCPSEACLHKACGHGCDAMTRRPSLCRYHTTGSSYLAATVDMDEVDNLTAGSTLSLRLHARSLQVRTSASTQSPLLKFIM